MRNSHRQKVRVARWKLRLACWLSFASAMTVSEITWAQSPTVQAVSAQTSSPIPDGSSVGSASNPWTLDSILDRALQSHPGLSEIASKIDAARGAYVQAGLQPNPTVGYQGQQLGSGGLAEQHGVSFGRDIIRREKIQRSQAVAHADMHVWQNELEVMRFRVTTDVRIAFYNALAAQKQYELSNELLEVAKQGEAIAQQLRDAKEVSKIDVLQATLEKDRAIIGNETAANHVRATWQALASLTCLPVNCPQMLSGRFSDPADYDFCELLDALKASSPEIMAAQATIQKNREILCRAQVEPLPNLNVQGLVNWQDNGIGGKPDGGLQVAIPIPVRNRNQGAIHQALAELRSAEFALQKLELDLQNRLATAFEQFVNAKLQESKYVEKILPQAKESLELNRLAYRENEISFLSLLTAQRTYFEMSLAALDASRTRTITEAQMDGMLLAGSLGANAK
ncbi:MAG: TolC family protein [Pirellulales bacterium]